MGQQSPDADPGSHVREQVRGIITAEDLACLGVKVRPPIPVSNEERIALERLQHLGSAGLDPKPPVPGSSGSPSGSSEPSGSSGPSE
jgi:hypothetical protein